MHGPIDYIIVGFTGNNFKGDIMHELDTAIQNNTIAVLDMAVITKDAEGEVSSLELMASDDPVMRDLAKFHTNTDHLIDTDDIVEVGEVLEPSTSAGLLIIEHLWAKGLKQALIDAKGTLLAEGRIHPEAYAAIA
jgi:uncharacterized membrane protein